MKVFKVSSSQLNPKAITKLASTLATAGVEAVDISENPIGGEGGTALVKAIPSSSLKAIKIGTSFTVTIDECSTSALDCSNQKLGPGQDLVVVLSWWLSTGRLLKTSTSAMSL